MAPCCFLFLSCCNDHPGKKFNVEFISPMQKSIAQVQGSVAPWLVPEEEGQETPFQQTVLFRSGVAGIMAPHGPKQKASWTILPAPYFKIDINKFTPG